MFCSPSIRDVIGFIQFIYPFMLCLTNNGDRECYRPLSYSALCKIYLDFESFISIVNDSHMCFNVDRSELSLTCKNASTTNLNHWLSRGTIQIYHTGCTIRSILQHPQTGKTHSRILLYYLQNYASFFFIGKRIMHH